MTMKLSSSLSVRLGVLLLSVLVSLVAFVTVYEIVKTVRYHRWRENFDNFGWFEKITIPSQNPVLMWEYRPYGEVGIIKTNRYGFRDLDFESITKPVGVHRIAFVGDSVTLGMGIAFENTFVRQLERMVNRRHPERPAQMLNFSIDGYNAIQIEALIKTRVLEYASDTVVYVMCLNDFDFDTSSGVKTLYFKKPRSFFLARLERAYRKLTGIDFHRHHFRRNKDEVFASISSMRDSVLQSGARFVVAIVPIFPRNEQDWRRYHLRDLHLEIGRVLDAAGVPVVDLLANFEAQKQPVSELSRDAWHPNIAGHRIIAEGLANSILDD
jgi:lysophospholipase L1-like esterase